jgi:hypothetical protein
MPGFVSYIPILTTLISAVFGTLLLRRAMARPEALHHAWWAAGVYVFGLGTLIESLVTMAGWSPALFRWWYVSGALMGGVLLAQGSVYFHLARRTANRLTAAIVTYLAIATLIVAVAPLDQALAEPHRLSGRVLAWPWVRLLSPPINLYAAVFLIGTAVLSAVRHRRSDSPARFVAGNWLIAIGALLPGIGGSFSRLGHTEVLYVMEFLGILLIWRGYTLCVRRG